MLLVLNILIFVTVTSCREIFHTRSVIAFHPNGVSGYFGYSVLLSNEGVHVGAPKASSRVKKTISSPGLVFKCPVKFTTNNSICDPIDQIVFNKQGLEFSNGGFYGAAIAAMPNGKILACAPSTPSLISHWRVGKCYLSSNRIESAVYPLLGQHYSFDGSRMDISENATNNPIGFDIAGISVKVRDNNHILIGAPGVLENTGTIVQLNFSPIFSRLKLNRSINPYYTRRLEPYDYFGYSVEIGVFEKNGATLYVGGAPRSMKGFGQVIVYDPGMTEENKPMKIKAQLEGSQLGSYFGASLCAVDLNGDGISDLLVGAPNFVKSNTTYDQGAVFVYMSRQTNNGFHLESFGYVGGSGVSGAKFGYSIAQLGDINFDKYNDVAIGAPWEDDGKGVVYIYEGYEDGLKKQYSQRIQADGARGFGISISKGYDVDDNKCNDLAVGAYGSETAYLYRCIPTLEVTTMIKVLDAQNMNTKSDNLTTKFCVSVPSSHSASNVERKLKATLLIDDQLERTISIGQTEYNVTAKSGLDVCNDLVIKLNSSSDFSKPISIKFNLEPDTEIDKQNDFPRAIARLSEKSILNSAVLIQLEDDCGEDLVCTPWLEVTLKSLNSYHVPGDGAKLGAKVEVVNTREPAYSARLHVKLPCGIKRLPSSCYRRNLDLYCNLPTPLHRNQREEWDIEFDYKWKGNEDELKLVAKVEDILFSRNITGKEKTLTIPITPKSNYTISGRTEPNRIVTILRETFDNKKDIIIKHIYEVTNKGPSALYHVEVVMIFPEELTLSTEVKGAALDGNELKFAISEIQANEKSSFDLPLRFNYLFAEKMEENLNLNITSKAYFNVKNYYKSIGKNETLELTTKVLLEPKSRLHIYIIIGVLIGTAVLSAIVVVLHKFGFFSRQKKELLLQAAEENSSHDDTPGTSSGETTTM